MLSPAAMLTIFDLIHTYNFDFDSDAALNKFENILKLRRNKNDTFHYNNLLLEAIRVHYNSRSPLVRSYITKFFHYIVSNP